ncbi:hypothetical protein RIF29_14317 [Crotalaria pallida]|uniref:Uncharacterized protein n=1 Tax=Crotalaria pallida TaxID=3830 RepID=A0AAN9FHB6_CROPI
MKLRAFSNLLLGCLLVMTTQGLGDSLSRVSQGQEENKNKFEVARITSMFAQKAPFEKTGGAHHMRKLGPGGKQLTPNNEETSMDFSKNGKGAAGEGASKISGATYSDGICDFEREGDHKNVKCKGDKSSKSRKSKMDGFVGERKDASQESLGGLRDQKNNIHQEIMILGPKVWKFTRFALGSSRPTNTNTKCSKDCNAVVVKASLKSSSKSKEPQGTAQKDAEAAKEISSLIYKDYKGKPSHKPPINNHDPGN